MKTDCHCAAATLATAICLGAAGCTSSYSVEVPAAPPSAGAPPAAGNAPAHDIAALTQSVNWHKVPVATLPEGF